MKGRASLYSSVAQAEVEEKAEEEPGGDERWKIEEKEAICVVEWDIMLEIADKGSGTSHQEKRGPHG